MAVAHPTPNRLSDVPLETGAEPRATLAAIGVALLAALLSLDGIFRPDFEDGTLEQLVLSAHPVPILVLAGGCPSA